MDIIVKCKPFCASCSTATCNQIDRHLKINNNQLDKTNCTLKCASKVTINLILILLILTLPISIQSKRISPARVGIAQYRTATACENSVLEIVCEKDTHINLIRANFGRFSIQTCNEHGSHEMKVDCMSPISFRVMEESCGMKQSCVIPANADHFGDPCPETPKYLEAHYQCLPDNLKKRYRWQSTTPRSKLPGKPLSSPSTSLPTSSSFSSTPASTWPSVTQPSGLSSASFKPEPHHVHPNVSKDENSMKNGLTHPNSGYSVAAGTSTHINASRLDHYDTSLSITKSGSNNNNNNVISLKVNPIELNQGSTSSPPISSTKSTLVSTSTPSTIGYNKLSSPITPNLETTSSTTLTPIKASTLLERSSTPSVKVTNDFDDRPIYIRHPHPGSLSESDLNSDSQSSDSSRSKSDLPSPYPSHRKSTTGSSESDYNINIYESLPSSSSSSLSSSSTNNVKLDKVSDPEYGSSSIFIRHPHPGVNRESSSSSTTTTMVPSSSTSSYDEQWMKSDSGSEMINEKSNQMSTNSWLSGNLSSNNLVTGIVFALGAALSALGLFFYLYIRDANIKNRFLSLVSALNGKIICSRNIGPMEPGANLKDDVSTLRKRGGHLISVTPTSKYMASENAAHYIRDPIIGPGSGSTLNVISQLGVKYLLPSTGNPNLGSSVKDLTYGCSQLMNPLTVNNGSSLTATAPSVTSNQQQQHQQQQQIHHHRLSSSNQGILGVSLHPGHHHVRSTTAAGLPLPIGLVVEHVYECIDDDPYTAKLFMPVDCESNKYQRRDNSIYNGGDFMLPINNHHVNNHNQQQQQQQQHTTDLTATLQALPAIVQENVSLRSSGLGVSLNTPSGLSQSTPSSSSSSHPHYQLNFACYPCQSQVVNYINKDRIDQQLRENLSLVNPNDPRRPEIV